MDELKERLAEAEGKLKQLRDRLSIADKQKKIQDFESESQREGFWTDEQRAKQTMQELSELKEDVDRVGAVAAILADARAALELGMTEELAQKLGEARGILSQLERATYLSGPYDHSDAYLSVHAGQGGIEAMDWAAMLLRMYQRYVERRGWNWELIDEQLGEEAGIKSATLLARGRYAFGHLRGERGTHRLVRQSPFNADALRQTSFASVQVMPVLREDIQVTIRPEDVELQAFRSSGKGGQNVNKVSTAVRLRHIPTGVVVACQSQRYQEQNRKIAMELLRAKLWEMEEEKHRQELAQIRGNQALPSWGTQIRSYVLHPYKLVKDVRTGRESHDPGRVLDGELDDFIAAELQYLPA